MAQQAESLARANRRVQGPQVAVGLRTASAAKTGLTGRLKLARLLEMPGKGVREKRARNGGEPALRAAQGRRRRRGTYAGTRFATRRSAGGALRAAATGSTISSTAAATVELMQRIGQKKFEECFLNAAALGRGAGDGPAASPRASAAPQGVSRRVYISRNSRRRRRGRLASACSAVAGIDLDDGRR